VLVLEMWVLGHVGERRSLTEAFRLDVPIEHAAGASAPGPHIAGPFRIALTVLAAVAVLSFALPQRVEASAERSTFFQFPMQLGAWKGAPSRLSRVELDALRLDDYILANYADDQRRLVNFYVAYYDSQRKGESAHSPRSCIPGGGWEIADLTQREVADVQVAGRRLRVNRVVIQKGDDRELVYYWFQQRSRVITSEYLVKWYLFWDSLTRNRTDGALVRLLTYVGPGQSIEQADAQLVAFAAAASPALDRFIPR